jgi:phospholipase C
MFPCTFSHIRKSRKKNNMLSNTSIRRKSRLKMIAGVSMTALMGLGAAVLLPHNAGSSALAATAMQPQSKPENPEQIPTETPIKHVIYIVGENRSFDNIYGTYQPKNGQTIWNLLSQGIVKADGTPGKNFAKGRQSQATSTNGRFFLSPLTKSAYTFLPVPTIDAAQPEGVGVEFGIVDANGKPTATFPKGDPDLPLRDQITLATGGTGSIPKSSADTRIPGVTRLPSGPFQQTGPTLSYDAYEGDTIHQLFQMWQQNDCSMKNATRDNPTGCLHDLYPFVATTNGTLPTQTPTDGGQDMAFFNMNTGDAPIFKKLADNYTLSDNFHQAIMGGSVTGAIGLAYADNAFYSDGNGHPLVPPSGIMNPDPVPGTVNTYQSSGTWVNCSDPSQRGVAEIHFYLSSLHYYAGPNCAPNAYYATRDADPAYDPSGALVPASAGTMPPLTQRHIGDALDEKKVSWIWYDGGYDSAVAVAHGAKDIFNEVIGAGYGGHSNPFQYSKSVMGDANARAAHLKDDTDNLFDDIKSGNLPAVAFVKPDGALQGHPGSGKVSLLEEFIQNIVDRVKANPKLFAETAIIISFDESGGLYDSGFIEPVDFFGDGPRIPMLVISPYSTGGHVVHSYTDQASVLKFIERNWHLGKISNRSRDNLQNPVMDRENPWVPVNMPAIGDLFDMFDFDHGQDSHDHDGDQNHGDRGNDDHHDHDDNHDHDNDGDHHDGDRF